MPYDFSLFLSGSVFGLTAGISPGPLLALVVSETLRYGRGGGIRVALAPLCTDLPIIILSLFIIKKISDQNLVPGLISIAGALFILYLAYDCVTIKKTDFSGNEKSAGSLSRGIIANFLSPHPYLFWLTVGAPVTSRAWKTGILQPVFFLAAFYFCLVGSKIIIALLVDKSRSVLQNKTYIIIMRVMGAALFLFALLFLREGIVFLMK